MRGDRAVFLDRPSVSRVAVLASGCRGRTSRGVTTTMRPTPGTRPRVSTLATPHAWRRSSLPSSAGPPPGSAAIRPRARARTRARTHAHAHAHTHAHACSHVCSRLLPCLAFCPASSPGLMLFLGARVPSVCIRRLYRPCVLTPWHPNSSTRSARALGSRAPLDKPSGHHGTDGGLAKVVALLSRTALRRSRS